MKEQEIVRIIVRVGSTTTGENYSMPNQENWTVEVGVPAIRRGALALHKTLVDISSTGTPILASTNDWTVTHVPTGRSIVKHVPCEVGRHLLRVLPQMADWENISYPLPTAVGKQLKRRIVEELEKVMRRVP